MVLSPPVWIWLQSAYTGSCSKKILLLNRVYQQLPVDVWKLEYRLNTNKNPTLAFPCWNPCGCLLCVAALHGSCSLSAIGPICFVNKPVIGEDLYDLLPAEAIIYIWIRVQIAYFLYEWLLYWFINLKLKQSFICISVITPKPLQFIFGNASKLLSQSSAC